jgi:hypothetical protein
MPASYEAEVEIVEKVPMDHQVLSAQFLNCTALQHMFVQQQHSNTATVMTSFAWNTSRSL